MTTNPISTTKTTNKTASDRGNRSRSIFKQGKGGRLATIPNEDINYKNIELLKQFMSAGGRILPSRITGTSHNKQRKLREAIIQARMTGLLPFVTQFRK